MKKLVLLFVGLCPLFFQPVAQAQQTPASDAKELSGIEVGAMAPLLDLKNENNTRVSLADALKSGPVILVFYRGEWCPVCNRFLSALEDSVAKLEKEGARVFAVSAEKPEYLQKMKAKTGASFTFLSDSAYAMMSAFGLVYELDNGTRLKYKTVLGANIPEATGDDRVLLPVPATYIIGSDGKVLWKHFDPDYRKRATVSEMLEVLK